MSSESGPALAEGAEQASEQLSLRLEITNQSACRKHVSVTVSESDVAAIRNNALGELTEKAQVPGFRVGKVPRALLEKKYKAEISGDIKKKVLLASLQQLSTEHNVEPIGEPNLDVESLDVPDTGDFHYEFDVEVRPDFEVPDYASICIRREVGEPTDEECRAHKEQFMISRAERLQSSAPASSGDYVVCRMKFTHEGRIIRESEGQGLQLLPKLNFQDAVLDGFDKLMEGAVAGDVRSATVTISLQSPIVEMRGEAVQAEFTVTEVQNVKIPVVDKEFLERLGTESEEELDGMLRDAVRRQIEYQTRQETRRQVLSRITESADWELPETLVRQQTENALRREILEMSQAGFTREQIMARENQIRQDALNTTRQALKEHFVLDRIATEQKIKFSESDIDQELKRMSFQSGEPVRKIRARMAKSGMIENLAAQLRERNAVDFILSKVSFEDVPRKPSFRRPEASARFAICGNMGASLVDNTVSEPRAE